MTRRPSSLAWKIWNDVFSTKAMPPKLQNGESIIMKPRLVLACLMPVDVNIRAREEFDALIVGGKNDMTGAEVAEAVAKHRADAVMFTNTLPLNADLIGQLPES